jgi:hypothetical protein
MVVVPPVVMAVIAAMVVMIATDVGNHDHPRMVVMVPPVMMMVTAMGAAVMPRQGDVTHARPKRVRITDRRGLGARRRQTESENDSNSQGFEHFFSTP